MAEKPLRYQVWLEQAGYDLEAAKRSRDQGFYEWSCFQAEQSLEKQLKAVLVHAGMHAPRIHKLGVLMGMCNQVNPDFLQIKIDFRRMESYTFVSRYPFLLPGVNQSPHKFITLEDADECTRIAEQSLITITEFLHGHAVRQGGTLDIGQFTVAQVDERIQDFVQAVIRELAVSKIVLFGGFSRNKVQPRDRTMDVLVIAETKLPFFERSKRLRDLIKGGLPIIEPLVYTPTEFDQLLNDEGEGFLESAVNEGTVIYERAAT